MSVIFDSIIGHKPIIDRLKRVEVNNKSFMFCGPSGVGKRQAAMGLAQRYLCSSEELKPCGTCSDCTQIALGRHPDLLLLSPGESPTIKIEEVRELQKDIFKRSFMGRGRVIIIDEAQAMTTQAANSLLKTLEEPPDKTIFILITSNPGALLATIHSRCQKVLFGNLSQTELKKLNPDIHDPWLYELSQGRQDMMVKLTDPSHQKWRNSALSVFAKLGQVRLSDVIRELGELSDEKDSALFTTQCWSYQLKTLILQRLNTNKSAQDLLTMSQQIMRLEVDIQANINRSLAFENFWLQATELMGPHISTKENHGI